MFISYNKIKRLHYSKDLATLCAGKVFFSTSSTLGLSLTLTQCVWGVSMFSLCLGSFLWVPWFSSHSLKTCFSAKQISILRISGMNRYRAVFMIRAAVWTYILIRLSTRIGVRLFFVNLKNKKGSKIVYAEPSTSTQVQRFRVKRIRL